MSEPSKAPQWGRMSMCFLNQKGGLSSAKAAQANKQKPVNGRMGAAGRSQDSKLRTIISLVQPEGGRAFEDTDRLNRTFHLRGTGDGRSGCTQPPGELIKACCGQGAGGCTQLQPCSPPPPPPPRLHGPPRAFWRQAGCPCGGLWENPARGHGAASPPVLLGRGN